MSDMDKLILRMRAEDRMLAEDDREAKDDRVGSLGLALVLQRLRLGDLLPGEAMVAPREPTEAMLAAGADAGGFDAYRGEDNTAAIYRAMLKAAATETS